MSCSGKLMPQLSASAIGLVIGTRRAPGQDWCHGRSAGVDRAHTNRCAGLAVSEELCSHGRLCKSLRRDPSSVRMAPLGVAALTGFGRLEIFDNAASFVETKRLSILRPG